MSQKLTAFLVNPGALEQAVLPLIYPLIQFTADKDGDAEKARQFTLQVGTLSSALEHITPEQMFAPTDPNDGSGVYKISGGLNGSYFSGFLFAQSFLVLAVVLTATMGPLVIAAAYVSVISIIAGAIHVFLAATDGGIDKPCFLSGISWAFSVFASGLVNKVASQLFGSIKIPEPRECLGF